MITGLETDDGWTLSSPDRYELRRFCISRDCEFDGPKRRGKEWVVVTRTDPIGRWAKAWTWYKLMGDDFKSALVSFKIAIGCKPLAMKPTFGKNFSIACEIHDAAGHITRGLFHQYSLRTFGRK